LRDPKEAAMPDTSNEDTLTMLMADAMPLSIEPVEIDDRRVGLVIVDEVNGFATVGAGNLAPPVESDQVSTMVRETDRLAREFSNRGWSILAFLDTHVPGKPEPPYPPHCEAGTGEEDLVPELAWLESDPNAILVRKDCINGFIGAIQADGSNRVVDWVNQNRLQVVLVVGICTDICVMDFVLTILSARNHDMMSGLEDIVVHAPGCATYDLPRATTRELGLPESLSHPGAAAHHMGLYFMASRGAMLTDTIRFSASPSP